MIKYTGSLVISNLVFGVLLGFTVGSVGALIGKYLFTFDDPRTPYALIISLTIVNGIVFLGIGIYEDIVANRRTKRLFSYLGANYREDALGIAQSIDEKRRIRLMSADFPKHCHLEALDPLKYIVLVNYVDGEPENADGVATTILMAKIGEGVEKPLVHHFIGLPPEITQQRDQQTRLPQAQILLIEDRVDGIYLFRFTKNGDYAGDTWHQSIEEAKAQAEFEYGIAQDAWHTVPDSVEDVVRFALNL